MGHRRAKRIRERDVTDGIFEWVLAGMAVGVVIVVALYLAGWL